MTENDAGIRSYVNAEISGFKGILKHRYSDFLVREVTPSGQVLVLTDAPKPSDFEVQKKEDSEETRADRVEEGLKELEKLLGEDSVKSLRDFVKDEDRKSKSARLPHVEDKDTRRQIHQIIREKFESLCLETNTELLNQGTPDETKCITVYVSSRSGGKHRNNRSNFKAPWPFADTNYVHFTLYKENVDTIRAVDILSRMLHVSTKLFSYAGTKDKRAITCQRVCAHRILKQKLARVNTSERSSIRIGDMEYAKSQLSLGELQGNRFDIILREIHAAKESKDSIETIVRNAVESLGKNGFLNYFGLQRFGRGSSSTNKIGAAILRKDWEDVLKLILNSSIKDDLDLKDKDSVSKAMHELPRYGTKTEYSILKMLCRGDSPYVIVHSKRVKNILFATLIQK